MARDCNDLNPKEVKELFNQYLESNPIELRSQNPKHMFLWFDNESGRKGLMSHYIDQFDDEFDYWRKEVIDTKNKYLQYLSAAGRRDTISNPHPNFPPHTRAARISSDYRGFLLNHHWLFYQGDNYSIYYAVSKVNNKIVGIKSQHYNTGFNWEDYEQFSTPNLLDITTLICNPKPKNSFMNWTENPLEGNS
jgi:hypothetical protein